VVGLGRIGTAAVLRAKAFGMDVVMYDPYRENGAELAWAFAARTHWRTVWQCDVVSLHLPLSSATEKLINAEGTLPLEAGLDFGEYRARPDH